MKAQRSGGIGTFLGIDVGTASVKAALLDRTGRLVRALGPERHEGHPARVLAGMLGRLDPSEVRSAAVTGAGRTWASEALGIRAVNGLRALSKAFARRHPFSHGLGQMRPRTAGRAMSCFTVTIASRRSPSRICRSIRGMSMLAGQANQQGARQSPTWSLNSSSRAVRRIS